MSNFTYEELKNLAGIELSDQFKTAFNGIANNQFERIEDEDFLKVKFSLDLSKLSSDTTWASGVIVRFDTKKYGTVFTRAKISGRTTGDQGISVNWCTQKIDGEVDSEINDLAILEAEITNTEVQIPTANNYSKSGILAPYDKLLLVIKYETGTTTPDGILTLEIVLKKKVKIGGSGVSTSDANIWNATQSLAENIPLRLLDTSSYFDLYNSGGYLNLKYGATTLLQVNSGKFYFKKSFGGEAYVYYYRGVGNGLTAYAGGGQTNATPMNTEIARFTTVATAGDSARLPGGLLGMRITIINDGANAMDLFPYPGQYINGTQDASYSIPAGAVAEAICYASGYWKVYTIS